MKMLYFFNVKKFVFLFALNETLFFLKRKIYILSYTKFQNNTTRMVFFLQFSVHDVSATMF